MPTLQRLAFPPRAPRQLTLAWWPEHVFAAPIDGYHWAFFASLNPQGKQ